jgi:hypothetical protein
VWSVREILDQLVPLCEWHHNEGQERVRSGAARATAHLTFQERRSSPALFRNLIINWLTGAQRMLTEAQIGDSAPDGLPRRADQ